MKTEKIEQIRSSRPEVEVFCKKFHKTHRKTPVPESLFNKVQASGECQYLSMYLL